MIWKIYTPIPDVSIIDDSGRRPGTLRVTSCPGAATPISITMTEALSIAMTVEQLDELMEQLGQARAAAEMVVKGKVAS